MLGPAAAMPTAIAAVNCLASSLPSSTHVLIWLSMSSARPPSNRCWWSMLIQGFGQSSRASSGMTWKGVPGLKALGFPSAAEKGDAALFG